MNEMLEMLSGGDLRSDGRADEVADQAARDPRLLDQLIEGLTDTDDVIRARTAHALERISRTRPQMIAGCLPRFLEMAVCDRVPMVKWHLAMIFGNLVLPDGQAGPVIAVLLRMLEDESVFVRSWSIVGLTILGSRCRPAREKIAGRIRSLQHDGSAAIRNKVKKSLMVLERDDEPLPAGWAKGNVQP